MEGKAMYQVDASKVQNTWEALLDRVEQGEEIRITRHGKRFAKLVPDIPAHDPEDALKAVEEIRTLANKAKRGPFHWEEWKAYRDDRRR